MTQHIYVDTNATAGGDGTTRAHTGANAAFASGAAAAAVVPQPLVETVYIHFAGTIEDSTLNFLTINGNASFRLYLVADEGDDHSADGGDDGTGYDGDGFNPDAGGAWSTSHYRANSTGFMTLGMGNYTTVDRLQLRNTRNSSNAEVVRANSSFGIIQRNRLTKDGISGRGIWLSGSSVSYHTLRVFNNLIFRCASWGMTLDSRVPDDVAARVQHNTIVNCGSGISVANQGNNPTFEVYNNAVIGTGGVEYNNLDGAGMTVNATHNAGEAATAPAGHDSNWVGGLAAGDFEQLSSTSGNYDDIDWRPAAGSILLDAGVNQGIDFGFNDTPRADPPTIGAFEAEGSGTPTIAPASLTQGHNLGAAAVFSDTLTPAALSQAHTLAAATVVGPGDSPDITTGVDFDGSTWLTRAALAGATDNKTILFSAYVKRTTATTQSLWRSSSDGGLKHSIGINWNSNGRLTLFARNGTGDFGDIILNIESVDSTLPSDGEFHAILVSANLGTGVAVMVIDGAEVTYASTPTVVDDTISWGVLENTLGALLPVSGGNEFVGCMGEFVLTNQFLDPLGAGNYAKFFDGNDEPVDKGVDGSTPTGTAPLVYCSGDAAQFADNFGSGGAFSVTGTLADCSLDGAPSVDPASLTQGHNLAAAVLAPHVAFDPANLTQAHTLAQTSVSSATPIDPNNLIQAHALAQAVLLPAYVLTANSLVQAHTLAAPSLVVANQIIAAGLTNPQTLGQPTLSALYVIGPAGLTQVHSLSQPVLTTADILAANNIGQGQAITQPLISATYLVDPANITQAHNLDPAVVTDIPQVNPNDLGHGHNLAQAGLVPAYALSPAMLTHVHTIGQPVLAPAVVVAPESLTQAHTLSEPLLVLLQQLSPASITLAQNLGVPVVVSIGDDALVPEALRHANTISIPVLAPATTLDVQSIVQAHLLTNAVVYVPQTTLSSTHQLIVLDASDQVLVMNPKGGVVVVAVQELLMTDVPRIFN